MNERKNKKKERIRKNGEWKSQIRFKGKIYMGEKTMKYDGMKKWRIMK